MASPNEIWQLPEGEKVIIEFNNQFQPIGPGSEKFRRIAGNLIKNGKFVDFRTKHWRKVPKQNKEDLWTALMVWNTY
jgi:hypothetical protein